MGYDKPWTMETRGIHLEAASVLIFELEGAPRKLMEVGNVGQGDLLRSRFEGSHSGRAKDWWLFLWDIRLSLN